MILGLDAIKNLSWIQLFFAWPILHTLKILQTQPLAWAALHRSATSR